MLDTPAQPTTPLNGVQLVHDEHEFLAAIRARLDELGVTYDSLDRAAGLPDRFSSKILCRPPVRHVSALTLWLVLGAVGLDLALIPNPEALARVQKLLVKRKITTHRHTSMITIARRRMSPWLFDSQKAKEMGRLGGLARAAKHHARVAVSEMKRQAACARWRKRAQCNSDIGTGNAALSSLSSTLTNAGRDLTQPSK
jgi:hypothetical protein